MLSHLGDIFHNISLDIGIDNQQRQTWQEFREASLKIEVRNHLACSIGKITESWPKQSNWMKQGKNTDMWLKGSSTFADNTWCRHHKLYSIDNHNCILLSIVIVNLTFDYNYTCHTTYHCYSVTPPTLFLINDILRKLINQSNMHWMHWTAKQNVKC